MSGGVQKAEQGALTIMVGGDAVVLEDARDVLQDVGANIFHVGGIGAGHTAKAVNNLITATTLAITSEAMALGVKMGVNAQALLDVINAGSGRSAASETKFPQQILSRRFAPRVLNRSDVQGRRDRGRHGARRRRTRADFDGRP